MFLPNQFVTLVGTGEIYKRDFSWVLRAHINRGKKKHDGNEITLRWKSENFLEKFKSTLSFVKGKTLLYSLLLFVI